MTNAATAPVQAPSNGYRWMQLIIGVVCMGMIANLQYGWTYFVSPMAKAHSWDVGSIQVAFSIFVALETWLTPLQGWIVDTLGPNRGPKLMVAAGGVFVALLAPFLFRGYWEIHLALWLTGLVALAALARDGSSSDIRTPSSGSRSARAASSSCCHGCCARRSPARFRAGPPSRCCNRGTRARPVRCSRLRCSGCSTSCSCWCPPRA